MKKLLIFVFAVLIAVTAQAQCPAPAELVTNGPTFYSNGTAAINPTFPAVKSVTKYEFQWRAVGSSAWQTYSYQNLYFENQPHAAFTTPAIAPGSYEWRARAVQPCTSAYSGVETYTLISTRPPVQSPKPMQPTAVTISGTRATVSWREPNDSVQGYQVTLQLEYPGFLAHETFRSAYMPAGKASYVWSDLSLNTGYSASVVAVYANSTSDAARVTFKTTGLQTVDLTRRALWKATSAYTPVSHVGELPPQTYPVNLSAFPAGYYLQYKFYAGGVVTERIKK